jgi:hypothetical protein
MCVVLRLSELRFCVKKGDSTKTGTSGRSNLATVLGTGTPASTRIGHVDEATLVFSEEHGNSSTGNSIIFEQIVLTKGIESASLRGSVAGF